MPSRSRFVALQFSRLVALLPFLFLGVGKAFAAGDGHEALPTNAEAIPDLPPVTNSIVMVWVVALVIIVVCRLATRKMRLVPSGLQNFVEWLVESLFGFFADILGERLAKRTFWFLATAFIVILFANWAGLVPGVGTVGWELSGEGVSETDKFRPLLRGANADLNLTLAMSAMFFLLWIWWSFTEIGFKNFFAHIFAPKGKFEGVMLWLMVPLFLFVGVIEVISIGVRPVALMFRLYGNVFAGETMLETLMVMDGLPNVLKWIPALPFYFLELLVGLIQALVFVLLCAVFTQLMCDHEHEDHDDEEHADGDGEIVSSSPALKD
jgi:F-type H+-transporting ATPase subunit a